MNRINLPRRMPRVRSEIPTTSASTVWARLQMTLSGWLNSSGNASPLLEEQRGPWMVGSVDRAVKRRKCNPYLPGTDAFLAYEQGFDSPGIYPRN